MYKCSYCEKECKNISGLHKHEKHCHYNPNRVAQPNPTNDYNEQQCSYCDRICTSINSLKNHERLCKFNPDRIIPNNWKECKFNLSNRDWAKGLTKNTDSRISNLSAVLSKKYANGDIIPHQKGKHRTDAEKEKISVTMKRNPTAGGKRHGSGRGKKGWYKGFFCDSTYELVYLIYCIDNNIEVKRCDRIYLYEYNGEMHKYYPDFELSDGTLIETKGYHTDVVDAKLASVTDRQIKILYEKDLKFAFDWVNEHYKFNKLSDLYE